MGHSKGKKCLLSDLLELLADELDLRAGNDPNSGLAGADDPAAPEALIFISLSRSASRPGARIPLDDSELER